MLGSLLSYQENKKRKDYDLSKVTKLMTIQFNNLANLDSFHFLLFLPFIPYVMHTYSPMLGAARSPLGAFTNLGSQDLQLARLQCCMLLSKLSYHISEELFGNNSSCHPRNPCDPSCMLEYLSEHTYLCTQIASPFMSKCLVMGIQEF